MDKAKRSLTIEKGLKFCVCVVGDFEKSARSGSIRVLK